MIHGAHTCTDGGLDSVGAVRVRGNRPSPSVCLGDRRLNLGVRVLLRAGRNAFGQYGAGYKDFDEVGAILKFVRTAFTISSGPSAMFRTNGTSR